MSKVTLGYPGSDIFCNGEDWIASLEWEEHYTFNTSNGHSGRDQSISDVSARRINLGTYTSSKHTTNFAMFIDAGRDSLWLYMVSQYSNVNGSVSHTMNYHDASGRETPRRFDGTDEANGPHYVVYDMNTHEVIDFISQYNCLWRTGQTTAKYAFTATNILG